MHIHEREWAARLAPAQRDERHVAFLKITDPGIVAPRRPEHHRVDLLRPTSRRKLSSSVSNVRAVTITSWNGVSAKPWSIPISRSRKRDARNASAAVTGRI
jgi:hypothetical protein